MDLSRSGRAVVALLVLILALAGCSASTEVVGSIPPTASGSYSDPDNNSSIVSYAYDEDSILIMFSDGSTYTYTNDSAGETNVLRMKALALQGNGLNAFINDKVGDRYASHEEAQPQEPNLDAPSEPEGQYSAAFRRVELLLLYRGYPSTATEQEMFAAMLRLGGARGYFINLNEQFATLPEDESRNLALLTCDHWASGKTIDDFPADARMDAALVSLLASITVCTDQGEAVMSNLMSKP